MNFVVFGISVTIVGATVPKIIGQFGWSYLEVGLVISAAPVGYLLWMVGSGLLVWRLGPKRVLLLGLLFQTAGMAFFGMSSEVAFNLMMTFLMGLGQGSTETVTNFCVVQMEIPGRSRLMNLIHGAFPIGAVSGPLTLGLLINVGGGWQLMYRGLAGISLIITVALSLFSFDRFVDREESTSSSSIRWLVSRPLLILLCVVMLLFVGSELGVSFWISEYFVRVFGRGPSVGAWMVSVFWLGVLLGRLSISLGYRGHHQADLLIIFGCLSTVFLGFSIIMQRTIMAAALFFLCGLGFSAIYPLVMVLVGQNFGQNSSVAIGVVGAAGGVGSFSFPLIMASIANRHGIQAGFWFCTVASCIAAGVTLMLRSVAIHRGIPLTGRRL